GCHYSEPHCILQITAEQVKTAVDSMLPNQSAVTPGGQVSSAYSPQVVVPKVKHNGGNNMRALFIHPNFPAQFLNLAPALGKNPDNQVVFLTCDRGVSPTYYQRSQFPPELQQKISVLHDGVNSDFFQPKADTKLVLPNINLDLSDVEEIVTYVGRGMEPYRGFPQFMEAVDILLKRRPKCHVVIVGADRVAYGKALPDGKTYKELMLEKFDIDLMRVHFTGLLPYNQYRQVLQASSVHVYLTRPFVLSWSMLEAMSAGCLLVASDTAPVKEVIKDGENGLLADFFSPAQIAARVEEALTNPDRMAGIRQRARQTILDNYALSKLLPQQIALLQQVIEQKR
ncbi:MAG: glycosyltransferase, partial [Firmicutes bacterium]|nr:glycosyltransferase [Bacillota bacterium]